MLLDELLEDHPRRHTDLGVKPWIDHAMQRPDAAILYVHGSQHSIMTFRQPNVSYGQLIFGTKLVDKWRHNEILQAEYYGPNLHLVKFHFKKLFNPYGDPIAKQLMADAFAKKDIWDAERKLKYGRVDYQDLYEIVPPAMAAGYDAFRVYECAISGDSFGVTDAKQVEIVDRYPR